MLMYAEDADNLLETIDDNNIDKTLICARTAKRIMGLISDSDFCVELYQRGYSWMTITSKLVQSSTDRKSIVSSSSTR